MSDDSEKPSFLEALPGFVAVAGAILGYAAEADEPWIGAIVGFFMGFVAGKILAAIVTITIALIILAISGLIILGRVASILNFFSS